MDFVCWVSGVFLAIIVLYIGSSQYHNPDKSKQPYGFVNLVIGSTALFLLDYHFSSGGMLILNVIIDLLIVIYIFNYYKQERN